MTDRTNEPAAGLMCREHFNACAGPGERPTQGEVDACPKCQNARQRDRERIQRTDTIDPNQPWGQHIALTCKNHPDLRWSTKNISYIGARSIFYNPAQGEECSCTIAELIVAPPKKEILHD